MLTLVIIILFVALVILLFISRTLSPIPYFPSNHKDINRIVAALQMKNDQIIYDLGAGDGIVIFAAAREAQQKKLNARFVAVEINPVLLLVLLLRRMFHPNRKNITIQYGNIFTMRYLPAGIHDVLQATSYTFFAYISPWCLNQVCSNIKFQISNFKFISYFYPLPKTKPRHVVHGVHNIYTYRF